jgi:hypothetical protein
MCDYIIGYGSLLSAYSRKTYSGITAAARPVIAVGWRRGWTTRYRDEAATYVGVRRAAGAHLAAALLPIVISDELRHRERGYVFTEVSASDIHAVGRDRSPVPDGRFWIVVNREHIRADKTHPIPQTYIDTCLIGCLETGDDALARSFIQSTELWDGHWLDDREVATPLYPRRTPTSHAQRDRIDGLLEEGGVLRYRQSSRPL